MVEKIVLDGLEIEFINVLKDQGGYISTSHEYDHLREKYREEFRSLISINILKEGSHIDNSFKIWNLQYNILNKVEGFEQL